MSRTQKEQRRRSKELAGRVVQLYQLGWSGPRISKELDLSKATVIKIVRRAGVQVRRERGRSQEERFWDYVSPEPNTGCWLWLGRMHHTGYGYIEGKQAYKWAYEFYIGPVPDGLELDHKCRVRDCVSPYHLEPVSHRENMLRSPLTFAGRASKQTHCIHGHEFTPENTYVKNGARSCRTCSRERQRKYNNIPKERWRSQSSGHANSGGEE